MTTYYKATRLDGTDFRTGTIHYEVGKRVRPAASQDRRICGPGYLHASDVPTETLEGGWWPCRLFEVSGRPRTGFDTMYPHKGAFRQLTGIRELDAHLALGPQGHEVAMLIERAGVLTSDECKRLDAAWGGPTHAAWNAAWNAARSAAWNAARSAAWGAARSASWHASWDASWHASWDAASALVVRDLISQEHFDILYGPWRQVIETEQ